MPQVGTGVLHRGSDVLHHPARAVVPPPRLRTKWVTFSALLQLPRDGPGWALGRRFGGVRTLRNPATGGYFFERTGSFAMAVGGGDFKKSNFSNHV